VITHSFQTAVRSLSALAFAGAVTLLGACAMQANNVDSAVYQRAIDSPSRTAADREADAGRKPMAFLQFTQVRPGDKVMDMAAGAGYTSQLLALVTAPTGITWAQTPKAGPKLQERMAAHSDTGMKVLVQPFEDPYPADGPRLDLVTLVMNYHDIAYLPVDRAKMNKHIFDALKPGGHFVVIDHSAKPGTGVSVAKTLHRIDEATVKDELKQAGFVLEDESDFLRQPTDPREQAFFDMKGEASDKFALRFVRP
jgi:predicted methyltransferase